MVDVTRVIALLSKSCQTTESFSTEAHDLYFIPLPRRKAILSELESRNFYFRTDLVVLSPTRRYRHEVFSFGGLNMEELLLMCPTQNPRTTNLSMISRVSVAIIRCCSLLYSRTWRSNRKIGRQGCVSSRCCLLNHSLLLNRALEVLSISILRLSDHRRICQRAPRPFPYSGKVHVELYAINFFHGSDDSLFNGEIEKLAKMCPRRTRKSMLSKCSSQVPIRMPGKLSNCRCRPSSEVCWESWFFDYEIVFLFLF